MNNLKINNLDIYLFPKNKSHNVSVAAHLRQSVHEELKISIIEASPKYHVIIFTEVDNYMAKGFNARLIEAIVEAIYVTEDWKGGIDEFFTTFINTSNLDKEEKLALEEWKSAKLKGSIDKEVSGFGNNRKSGFII